MKIDPKINLSETQTSEWFAKISQAYRARKPHADRWERIREFYKGNYFTDYSDTDRVVANWIFAATRQMSSALYFQNPRMNFTPYSAQSKMYTDGIEKFISMERQYINCPHQERSVLENALKYGTGILKHAWNAEYGIEDPWADLKLKYPDSKGSGDPTDMTGSESLLSHGPFTETNTAIRRGHPWVKSIHPIDFLVDPDACSYEEASWVAHRFRRRWVDARRDMRWDDKMRECIGPGAQSTYYHDSDSLAEGWYDDPVRQESNLCTFYEVWDKDTGRIYVLTESCPQPLAAKPYPYLGKDGPYQILQFFPLDDTFWAMPYADTFSAQVLAMNKLRTQMMDHLQRHGSMKGAYRKGAISQADAQRFAETVNGFAEINTTEDIEKIMKVFPYVPIAADAWQLQNLFFTDYQAISGVSELDMGMGAGVQTATEASIMQQQSGLRGNDMRFQVDRFLSGSTRKIVGLLRQFFSGEKMVSVIGQDGMSYQVWIDNPVLNGQYGEYEVGIEPGSTEKVDRAARFRQYIELLQTAAQLEPLVNQMGRRTDFGALMERMYEESGLIKDPERILLQMQPAGPGQQQSMPGDPNAVPGQMTQQPAPAPTNMLGQMPTETDAFQSQRMLSEQAFPQPVLN